MGLFRRKQNTTIDDPSSVDKSRGDDSAIDGHSAEAGRPRRSLRRLLGGGSRRRNGKLDGGSVDDRYEDEDDEEEEEGTDGVDYDERPSGPPPTQAPMMAPRTFRPSHLQSRITEASNESTSLMASPHSTMPTPRQPRASGLKGPPPARASAFRGPPRFDWIDIVSWIAMLPWGFLSFVAFSRGHALTSIPPFALGSPSLPPPTSRCAKLRTYRVFPLPASPTPPHPILPQEYAAATKIQSIHRRNGVMRDLEDRGQSTSCMRNRRRRRKVASRSIFGSSGKQPPQSASVSSSPFSCCGIGLAFGAEEESDVYRELERKRYEDRVLQQKAHEEAIMKKFMADKKIMDAAAILDTVEVAD